MKLAPIPAVHILLAVCLIVCGCSGSDSADDQPAVDLDSLETETSLDSSETPDPEDGPPYELDREAESVFGPWLMYVKQEENELPIGELAVGQVPGTSPPQYQLRFRAAKEAGNLQVVKSAIEPEAVEVVFAKDQQFQIFQGRLKDGIVFGNLIGGSGVCVPARFVRPHPEARVEGMPHPAKGVYEFSEVLKSGAEWDDVVNFIEEHPESPLIPNALYTLSVQVKPRRIPVEQIDEIFELNEQYTILWGERLRDFVRLNSLLQLANDYRHPDYLESIRDSLVGRFEEEVWKDGVQFFMENLEKDIELCRQVDSIRTADENARSEILAELEKEVEQNPFNVKLLVSTAEALREAGDKAGAIEWYKKVVVVPGMEPRYLHLFDRYASELPRPSEELKELWQDVHGSEEGLEDELDREYETLLSSFDLPDVELPASNGKRVLLEFFNGTASPPSVAAALAFSAARDRLPGDRIVMLQYHVHVPDPDPLTCEGSKARFGYYAASGTPAVYVDGRLLDYLAGEAPKMPRVFQTVVDEVAEELTLDPIVQITADVTPQGDGTAAFTAAVDAEEISDRWRLHAVLAEGEVKYRGPNGVPLHEMVVRKSFTISQGQAPSGGKLSLEGTIDPDEIRRELRQQMDKLRERHKIKLEDGPLELDDLHLVVFVQDVQNRRIRQVVSVPVPSGSVSE